MKTAINEDGSGVPGALASLKVVEIGGVGPAPFASMMLADHGAEVIRIDRPGAGTVGVSQDRTKDVLLRSRKSVVLNLKSPAAIDIARALCKGADILIEGFRPGVMERFGLGPETLLALNPKLVYGRMTGWGQTGRYAMTAGHDLTYLALTGNLHSYGRAGCKPTPAVNAVGDFGGGGMLLAFGVLAAALQAMMTGNGQVVDCAMTDGASLLGSMIWGMFAEGTWTDERGVNLLDSGSPYYDTYQTADNRYVAIAPLEPQFFAEFLRRMQLNTDPTFACQLDRSFWPEMREKLTSAFRRKSRDEWCQIFGLSDACVSPVLSMHEAVAFPHNVERAMFIDLHGVVQPAPAPRFSLTPAPTPTPPPPELGRDTHGVLQQLGYNVAQIESFRCSGAFG